MANIGIAFNVVLSSVSPPVYDSIDEIPESLLSNLDISGIISSTDGLVVPKGRFKYVNGRLSTLQPKELAKSLASCASETCAQTSYIFCVCGIFYFVVFLYCVWFWLFSRKMFYHFFRYFIPYTLFEMVHGAKSLPCHIVFGAQSLLWIKKKRPISEHQFFSKLNKSFPRSHQMASQNKYRGKGSVAMVLGIVTAF
jgi:hypothetical protein